MKSKNNIYHAFIVLCIVSCSTLQSMNNEQQQIKKDLPSLASLAVQKVHPLQLLHLKEELGETIKLGRYNAIVTWPHEYLEQHTDGIVEIFIDAITDHENEEKNNEYYKNGKTLKNGLLNNKNSEIIGNILSKFFIDEQKTQKRFKYAYPLAPMLIYLRDASLKLKRSFIESLTTLQNLDSIELPPITSLIPTLYSDNPFLSRLLHPTTVCKFRNSVCCKSVLPENDMHLMQLIKKYHEENALLQKEFTEKYGTYAMVSEIASHDMDQYYLSLKIAAENAVEAIKEDTTQDKVSRDTLKLVSEIIAKSFLDIVFQTGDIKLIEQLFKQILAEDNTLDPKQVGNFWLNTPIPPETRLDIDICFFMREQCSNPKLLKQLVTIVIKSLFNVFHMDRQELHQFVSDIYNYRKKYCTKPKEEKELYLSLLDQMHQVIDYAVK